MLMNKQNILKIGLLSSVIVSGALVSCSDKNVRNYKQYEHIAVKDFLNKGNLKDKEKDTYYIYLYRENCGTCKIIQETLFDAIEKGNETNHKIYLLEYERENENPNNDVLLNLKRFCNDNTKILNGYYDSYNDSLTSEEKVELEKNINEYTNIVINDLKDANNGISKLEDITFFFTPSIYKIEVNKDGATSYLETVENYQCENYLNELLKNW